MFPPRKKAPSLGRVTALKEDGEYVYAAITPGLRDSRFLAFKKAVLHQLLRREFLRVSPHCAQYSRELDRFSWRGRRG